MDLAIVKKAEGLLQEKRSRTNSQGLSKTEKFPACVRGRELEELYEKTELEFTYVYAKCKEVKQLKDIELPIERIESFYIEFLHMGWTKAIFDRQLEAVKRAKLFAGVLDLTTWLESEIKYSEFEFEIKLNQRLDEMAIEGERLTREGYSLNENEEKCAKVWAYKKIKMQCANQRSELMEKLQAEEETRLLNILKAKKEKIKSFSKARKEKILAEAILRGHINKADKAEFNTIANHLEEYADLMPMELIDGIL
jgi:hypothetical protein